MAILSQGAQAIDSDLPSNIKGQIVNKQGSAGYQSRLPPEFAAVVHQDEFVFEATSQPRNPDRFLNVASLNEDLIEIGANGALERIAWKTLPKALFAIPDKLVGDLKNWAYRILWNATATTWGYKSSSLDLSTYIFDSSDASPHKFRFSLERIHPISLGESSGELIPVFREKISGRSPDVIRELSWLTLRYFGSSDDFVWVASPAIKKIRQITGSNRSDQIFSGTFSPDDLVVWSGKVEALEPHSVSQVSVLVALVEPVDEKYARQGPCTRRVWDGESGVILNGTSRRFKDAADWVPSNIQMVPRETWRVELVSRDPFSLEPRQAIYFDRYSHLPVYRIVWDHSGRLVKATMGIIRASRAEGDKWKQLIGGQIIARANDRSRSAIIFDSLLDCDDYSTPRRLADFDPGSFVSFKQQTEAKRP